MTSTVISVAGWLVAAAALLWFLARSKPPPKDAQVLPAFEFDADLNVRTWNDAATEAFGYDADEIIGRNLCGTLLPASWHRRLASVYRRKTSRGRFRHAHRVRRKNGTPLVCVWHDRLVTTRHDSIWRSDCVDVTAWHERSRTLRERPAEVTRERDRAAGLLDLALNPLGSGTFQYDFASHEFTLQEEWIARLGFDDNIERHRLEFWLQQIPAEDIKEAMASVAATLQQRPETIDQEIRIRDRNDTDRWVRIQARVTESNDRGEPRRMIGIVTDITELRAFRKQKGELESQLYQAQKMESIGQLTGGLVHDFNNMLSSILGYSDLIRNKRGELPDAKLAQYVEEIHHAGEQAQALVNSMLSFGKTSGPAAASASLAHLIDDAVRLLRPSLPSSIEFEISVAEDVPAVAVSPVKLTQLLMNLAINSKDAMQNVGVLTMAVREADIASRRCDSCKGDVSGRYVELAVTDTGCGIANELLPHIFDAFFSTKDVGRGTGMGLSMVHNLVHEAGGHILVTSQVGVGSTFRLLFPAATVDRSASDEAPTPSEAPEARRPGRVLVVDDEASVATFIAESLARDGHEVTVENDSAAALETFRSRPDAFDLVITDQTMPKMTGDQLMMALLEVREDIPVIICTGYSEAVNEDLARQLGAAGYLRKPIDPRQLAATVAVNLGRS